ncbi:hypothetical protein L6R50_18090 [Myxococcota bacterium]|nr:hypothetical protein [Myxococcota bacterium]
MKDEPRDFDTPEGPWRPRDAEGFYHPWVTRAEAFGKSLDVATTHLVARVGPERSAALARALPAVLEHLAARGWRAVTVPELAGEAPYAG